MEGLSAIAWPFAALLTAISFFAIYRSPISQLIARVTRIGVAGGIAEAGTPPSQDTGLKDVDRKVEEIATRTAATAGLWVPLMEGYATTVYEKSLLDFPDAEDRIKFLCNLVHLENRDKWFEATYRLIFGSQLYLLDQLNSRRRISAEEVQKEFEARKNDIGLSQAVFQEWIRFLTQYGLVILADGFYELTPPGREFLLYMIRNGYSLHKPL